MLSDRSVILVSDTDGIGSSDPNIWKATKVDVNSTVLWDWDSEVRKHNYHAARLLGWQGRRTFPGDCVPGSKKSSR